MAVITTEWRIEGLNPDGDWHTLDRPLKAEGDHLRHRDELVRMLRERGIKRYSRVRLAKYVTSVEVIGEDISV